MNENEIPEIVASKDLREVFAARRTVRGTFFINAVEIVPLSAAGIASLLEQINRYADKTFVDASVDENYHLVLEARSPAPILIRLGRLLDPTAAPDERNTVLVDLGLPETQPGLAAAAVVHGVAPGPAPEERRRLRHERGIASGAIRAWDPALNPPLPPLPLGIKESFDPPGPDHLARLAWERIVVEDAKNFFSEPAPEWVKEIAERTYPGPEQTQEASPPKPKLPEIGWGGEHDNRGAVGFPS